MSIAEKSTTCLRGTILLIALSAVPSWLTAQSIGVGGPASSYIFDTGRSTIRPLIGLAGSSFLGDAVLTGLSFASVAPNGSSAVAVWPDRVEWVADLSRYSDTNSLIGGSLASPDQIYWDSASAAAVFISSKERQVQFVQRSEGTFNLRSVSPPDSCAGSLKALAADAVNTTAAVLCTPDPDAGGTQGLFLLRPDAPAVQIQLSSSPVAAAFASNGSFYVAGSDSSIFLVRDPAANGNAELLFAETDSPTGAAALLAQSTEQLLYSADSSQKRIRVYDLKTFQQVDELPTGWQATQFQPFLNSFLMNTGGASSEPRLLLKTTPQRSVLFVPAGE